MEGEFLAFQDQVETLTRLGLTINQAKVYLTLASTQWCTVKTITKVSGVPRQEIYKILSNLQTLGLVEKSLTRPTKFMAIPLMDGISFLLQRKTEEISEVILTTKKIFEGLKKSRKKTIQEENPHFVLVPKKEAAINRRNRQIEAAQTSIDAIVTFNRLRRGAFTLHDVTKKALKRGVKIRAITEKPENLNEIPESIQDFQKNPSFKLRYILNSPLAVVTIYDRKEMLVTTSALEDLGESSALWSNNPSLLTIINDFFEIMWITAIEKPTRALEYISSHT